MRRSISEGSNLTAVKSRKMVLGSVLALIGLPEVLLDTFGTSITCRATQAVMVKA